MKRRDFIVQASMVAGLLVSAPLAVAREDGSGRFLPHRPVDEKLFSEINRSGPVGQRTLLEKKHAPVVTVVELNSAQNRYRVEVMVGEILHPMSDEHYVDFVQLFAGNERIGQVDFNPAFSSPQATFSIKLDRPVTLLARAYCNLHGLWEARVPFTPVVAGK